jgi:hypothetical protein
MVVWHRLQLCVGAVSVPLSCLTVILYLGDVSVPMGGERSAHFCEFVNDMVNALVALSYAARALAEVRQELDEAERIDHRGSSGRSGDDHGCLVTTGSNNKDSDMEEEEEEKKAQKINV